MEETRMSESITESTAQEPTETSQGDPVEATSTDATAELERVRAALKTANKDAEKHRLRLKEFEERDLSDLERAQKLAADAQSEATTAKTEAMRLRVAAKHGISDEDADLFLNGSDLETVERQAAALAARTSTGPKPDLTQGAKGTPAAGDPATDFANFLGAQMSGRG